MSKMNRFWKFLYLVKELLHILALLVLAESMNKSNSWSEVTLWGVDAFLFRGLIFDYLNLGFVLDLPFVVCDFTSERYVYTSQ